MSEQHIHTWSPDDKPTSAAVTLTPAAIAHVKKRMIARGSGVGFRFGVSKSGCNGLKYVVDYVDEKQTEDHVYPIDDQLSLYVDAKSIAYVAGTQIDFVREGLNETFKFNNPNEQGSCGCGESFNVTEIQDDL